MKKHPSNFSEVRMIVVMLLFSVLFGTSLVLGILIWAEFGKMTLGIILIGTSVLVLIFFLPILARYRQRNRQIRKEVQFEALSKIDGSDAFVPVSWGIVSNGNFTKRGSGVFFFQDGFRIEAETTKEYRFSAFQEIIQFPGDRPWIVLSIEHGANGFTSEGVILVDNPVVRKHIELRTGKPIDTSLHDSSYAEYLTLQKNTKFWGTNTPLVFQKVMFPLLVLLSAVALGLYLYRVTALGLGVVTMVMVLIAVPVLIIGYPLLFSKISKYRYSMNSVGFMIFHGRKTYGEKWKNLACIETTPKGIICVFETDQGEEGKVFFAVDERFITSLIDYPIRVRPHSSNELDQ